MPERPKRRKNNKNKRKNKNNNRTDLNKNCSDSKESIDVETCSANNVSCDDSNITEGKSNSELTALSSEKTEQQNQPSEDVKINTVLNNIESSNIYNKNELTTETQKEMVTELQDTTCIISVTKTDNQDNEVFSEIEISENYVVESPDQSIKSKSKKKKAKLANVVKSKSLDNDDAPKIIEITDDSNTQLEDDNTLAIIDSNVLVSDVDSDVEWEKADDMQQNEQAQSNQKLATGKISVTSTPLEIAQCEQTKSLTPEEEISLRHYLHTLNLATHPPNANSIEIKTEIEQIINREIKHRLRKKGLAEDFFTQRIAPPRILDVIDEEGSSESSITSRRQSYLSDKKSDNEDLEDDVFENPKKVKEKYLTKSIDTLSNRTFGRLVPQQCVLVGAKLKEPDITEARGDWTVKTVEKMTGAEVVYLTDSSSSTSSIYDVGEEANDGGETDASVRMITPTIEVTDTENLLKKSFISNNKHDQLRDNETELTEITIQPLERSTHISKENKIYVDENIIDHLSESNHEIVVLSTDNIQTNLYVKGINEVNKESDDNVSNSSNNVANSSFKSDTSVVTEPNKEEVEKNNTDYNLEIKVLKCELNDAINNLIKEVVSDSETNNENSKDTFTRQDSSSSVCSSQCTAKYNPTHSSLNDVSNILHDETCETSKISTENTSRTSHVKEVFESVTGISTDNKSRIAVIHPPALRDLCVRKIATFPYGDKILEELASVSERLQNITVLGKSLNENSETQNQEAVVETVTNKQEQKTDNMPYFSSPDVSSIERISLPIKRKDVEPPPVQPRNSSLKKSQDDHHWSALPTKTEAVYVCLSPSQKMLMEKTNTVITKEDTSQLGDTHKKFVDRRGCNEYYDENNKREKDVVDNTPVVPFKSQTGSRLLALIRDPSVTRNIDFSMNKHKSLDELQQNFTRTDTMPQKSYLGQINISKDLSNIFRPIPPPRPRKFSSSFYESDESSNFTDNSFRAMKSERKFFHYSTGNLNKEIENDISSIQNMHRHYTNVRDQISNQNYPRRPSLPKDLCDQQMEYIRHKEKEVETELRRLEDQKSKFHNIQKRGPRAPLISEKEIIEEKRADANNYYISCKKDISFNTKPPGKEEKSKLSSLFSSSQEEILRDKMYSEYINQIAERQERKHQKIIKITNTPTTSSLKTVSKSMPALDILDSKVNNRIEKEFISKARERWNKLGIRDPETEDEKDENRKNIYKEPKVIEHKIKVIEGDEVKDFQKLPSHLQEFVSFAAKDKSHKDNTAVWRPGAPSPSGPSSTRVERSPGAPPPPPPPPPVWAPASAGASPQLPRKPFRPVHFEETPLTRRKFASSEQNGCTSGSESEGRLRTSQSAPATGLNTLGTSASTSRLPRAQNPTVTLLQKAREGHIPRGSNYIQQDKESTRLQRDPPKSDPVYALRREYASEGEADRSDFERGGIRKMADAHRKIDGIGPTTKDGMPVALRSEVKEPSKWYKKMYDTIHKNKFDDDYVTIRYKSRRGQPPQRIMTNKSQYAYFDPRSGYLSEPEGGLSRLGPSTWSDAYDSDVTTGPRRRTASVQEERRNDDATSPYLPNNKYSTLASARASQEVYKNQPGRIENYVPGKSSVIDKEAKQWWDEVMDIFDGQISSTTSLPQASPKEKKDITSAILSKSNMARALKESGYESDSTLIFRRREETEAPLSPAEKRAAYRDLQAGGEPPLRGFRSPAPPRQESPRRYVESDVNIHYRCPVRHDPLPLVPERELARQQAEHMKRLYREQRRNKYLQELQDMQNRRHQDNFTPSQKTIVPLNRYDDAERIVARALYAFNGQTARELNFKKGDLIHVRRQIDNNWYEGELHGRLGLFPYNYVEILKGDVEHSPKKPVVVEGRAKAKFDFIAQTNLELPLKKGEVVVLTRRVDQNWWEGRNGNKTGIFPDSYVTILQEPSHSRPDSQQLSNSEKPAASPAAHGLVNGSGKRSMGPHVYTPQHNSPALANAPPATQPLPGYVAKPAQATLSASERGYGPPAGRDLNNTEPLYVDTNAEAVPYRAMYKYRPQNPDELELNEGDTVYVLEKCDDGWYVGSSQRTGRFGTFPGNYVERI